MPRFLAATALLFVIVSACQADLPVARLDTVFPFAAQRGQSVDVAIGGGDLEGVQSLYFSRPGVTATPAEGGKFKIAVAGDAPTGLVDVRAIGEWGISNPRTFVVSELPESVEVEPNNLLKEAKPIAFDSAVCGQIAARADVDYFRFAAPAGARVMIECFAERVDSRLKAVLTLYDGNGRRLHRGREYAGIDPFLDFVAPAAGDYIVQVNDLTFDGSPAHFYRLAIHARPRVEFAFPPVVSPHAAEVVWLYGRNLPGGSPETDAAIDDGPPLNVLAATVDPKSSPTPVESMGLFLRPRQLSQVGLAYRWSAPNLESNAILIGVSDLAVVLEQEPNDGEATAQRVTLPVEIVGQCKAVGDSDWFRFPALKGQTYSIEAIAERAGFPTDVSLVLRRILSVDGSKSPPVVNAQDLGEYDDDGTNVGRVKFDTSSHDPIASFTVPETGDYAVQVRDRYADRRGDCRFVYRLRVAVQKPDFAVAIMTPDENNVGSFVVRQGGTAYAQAFVVRGGGFAGELKLEGANLPPGVTVPPVVLAAGMNEAPVVFVADASAPDFAGPVTIRATATIDGATVTRDAKAGTLIWPAAGYSTQPSRLAQSLCLAVRPNAPYLLEASAAPATFGAGSLVTIPLKLQRRWPDFVAALGQIAPVHLPPNAEGAPVAIAEKQAEGTFFVHFKNNVAPGTYTFFVRGAGNVPFTKTPQDPNAKKADVPVSDASLPITVTVLPRPTDLAIDPGAPTVKPGQSVNVKVKITRVNDFKGPMTLSLTTPPGVAGVTAGAVEAAADKAEADLAIAVAGDVPAGDKPNLTIRASAKVGDQTVTIDAPFTLKVAN